MRRTGTDSGEFSPVARLTLKQAPTCTLLNTLRNSLLFFKYMIPLRSQQVSYTVVLPVNFDFITYHLSLSLRDESVTNLPNFVIRIGNILYYPQNLSLLCVPWSTCTSHFRSSLCGSLSLPAGQNAILAHCCLSRRNSSARKPVH